MKIPLARPCLGKEEAHAAYDTVMSHWVTQGPRVEEFEKKFASYVGSRYAVAVSSCTAALHLAMIVSGVREKDEVICPSLSYIATANSITYVKAKPVFSEVDPKTYNLDVSHAERLITSKTKAILLVHQMGLPADIDRFKKCCARHNLELIEDAACAAGASYKGKKIGSHSDLVCFSFHPRKVITTGDGGMLTTHNEKYWRRLKLLRHHGMSVSDSARHRSKRPLFEEHTEIGFNYRLTDIQAAVGIKQLEKLDQIVSERRKIAGRYNEAFKNEAFIRLPVEPKGCVTNYQSYPIYLKKEASMTRDAFIQKLWKKGVAAKRGIMVAHRETAYRKTFGKLILPLSEDASERSFLIPLYVPMSKKEVDYVTQSVLSALHD